MAEGKINIDNVTPTEAEEAVTPAAPTTAPVAPAGTDRTLLSWQGQTFSYREKTTWWYMAAGVAILAILGYFVWQQDWFSVAITVIISGVLAWYVASVRPQNVEYAITSFGLQYGDRFYPFTEIHSFWIIYHDKVKTLNVVFVKKYLPTLTIDLTNADPNQVRLVLGRKIPEQPNRTENILDRLVRALQL